MEKILRANNIVTSGARENDIEALIQLVIQKGMDIDFNMDDDVIDIDPAELQRYGRNRELYLVHTILFLKIYFPGSMDVITSLCWSFAAAGGGNTALSKMLNDFDRFYVRGLKDTQLGIIEAKETAKEITSEQAKVMKAALIALKTDDTIKTYGNRDQYERAKVLVNKAIDETFKRVRSANVAVVTKADIKYLTENMSVLEGIESDMGKFASLLAKNYGVEWKHNASAIPVTSTSQVAGLGSSAIAGQPIPIIVKDNARIDSLTWEAFSLGNLRRIGTFTIVEALIRRLKKATDLFTDLREKNQTAEGMKLINIEWNREFGCLNGFWIDDDDQSFCLILPEPHLFHAKLNKFWDLHLVFGHATRRGFVSYTLLINFIVALKTQVNIWANTKVKNPNGTPNLAFISSYYSTFDHYVRSNVPVGAEDFNMETALRLFKNGAIKDSRPTAKTEVIGQMEAFINSLIKKTDDAKTDAEKQAGAAVINNQRA